MQSTSDTEASPRISSSESESELGIKKNKHKKEEGSAASDARETHLKMTSSSQERTMQSEKRIGVFSLFPSRTQISHTIRCFWSEDKSQVR